MRLRPRPTPHIGPVYRRVVSTTLRSAAYTDHLLYLEFTSGEVYRYAGVPRWKFHQLMRAESKGGYFNRHIKPHHPFEKLT